MLEGLNEFARALVDIRDSSVTVVTELQAAQQTKHGSSPDMEFLFSKFLDRLWNPSSHVFDDYRWLYPLEQNADGCEVCRLYVVSGTRNCGAMFACPPHSFTACTRTKS